MTPYSPGMPAAQLRRQTGIGRVVKLASNENAFGPSPAAVRAIRECSSSAHVYPDAAAFELRSALAEFYGIEPKHILLGNGSDELIRLLGLILLEGAEDEVLVGDPSFVVYDDAAKVVPCRLVKVPLNSRFEHDLPAMAKRLTERTRLVFIANPNNPTGTVVRKPEVDRFVADLPDSTLLVLDEAYYEFAADVSDFPNSLDYVREGKNVAGLRTFSKAYGLAGLRCGYGFASSGVAEAIDRVRQPFNVNSLAQSGAAAALGDREHVARTVAATRLGAIRIAEALRAIGASPCESYANFVFADFGYPAKPVVDGLLAKGVIVRSGEGFGCPNAIRVTVGTDEEIDIFERALRESVPAGVAR